MPIIQSAIKRVRQTEKRRKRNLITKDRYRTLTKEFLSLVQADKKSEAANLFPGLQKAIDMATKKNILHKNNAARKKSRLAKMIAGVSVEKKKTTKKTTPKKTTATKKD
jgi:small subunit ribosomal protein S20